jgi:multimeric flavodoxin WrbA
MKITILNGNPEPTGLDSYLNSVKLELQAGGHSVIQLDLRDKDLQFCVGCWGCWVKTPGECVASDASHEIGRAVINSDFTLWATPLKMGFVSALLKKALDKHLPLIHPYMVVDHGEAHHLKRYSRYPRIGLLLEKEAQGDELDLQIVTNVCIRTALNFKTRLEFSLTTDIPPEQIAHRITAQSRKPLPLPKYLPATRGTTIPSPGSLTLFNGSPRGAKGNTPIFLREIANGFNGPHETHHLIKLNDTPQMIRAFKEAECAILGFPLYADAIPGLVKNFVEALEPFSREGDNPPLGFVVQSGFPESLHSRFIERYLEKLAGRLGSPYLGTIVKGNGEPVRMMSPEMNRSLFEKLQALGAGLAKDGRLEPKILRSVAHPERFPAILDPVFRVFVRLPVAHFYFDSMLKKNGAYEKRFARPFIEKDI